MKVIVLLAAAVLFLSSVAHAGPVPDDDDLPEFEERGEPSEFYLDEIRKQIEAGRRNAQTADVGDNPMRDTGDTQSNSGMQAIMTLLLLLLNAICSTIPVSSPVLQ